MSTQWWNGLPAVELILSQLCASGTMRRDELIAYRDRTMALLRRFSRASVEVGRLPSLVGREYFGARVSARKAHTFEDRVIFAYDVERCLALLDRTSQMLIARVALQDCSYEEAARLLHCGTATVARRFPQALDQLSELLLERELLQPIPGIGDDAE